MKKIIKIVSLALGSLVLFPALALAGSVQVYPTITNAHGGTATAAQMRSCITYGAENVCSYSVPTFEIPDGTSYSISVQAPSGYSSLLGANCAGVMAGSVVCEVTYNDGAPIAVPLQAPLSAPVATPAPSDAPGPSGGGVSIPPNPFPNATSTDTKISAPTSTVPTVIIQRIYIEVPAVGTTTNYVPQEATSTDSTTTKQIADLQQRVSVIERLLNAVVSFLRSIFNF